MHCSFKALLKWVFCFVFFVIWIIIGFFFFNERTTNDGEGGEI